ncbi:MAG: S8 family serine peptidase [bacterium]
MVPNDPYYQSSGSWDQNFDDFYGLKKIHCEEAWDISQGEGVVVAVIDTGVDYNHEDIAENIWINPGEDINHNGKVDTEVMNHDEDINHNGLVDEGDFNGIDDDGNGYIDDICDLNRIDDDGNGYIDDIRGWNFVGYNVKEEQDPKGNYYGNNDPMDDYGHGMHCAGTIAAVGNNNIGVIGVAPKARIMPVKGLDNTGYGTTDNLAMCIKYAADSGAKVLSNSWGPSTRVPSNRTMEEVIDYVYAKGCIVIFASGNSDDDVAYYSPANYSKTIAVAAIE